MQTIPALCETLGTGLTGVFEYNAADWKPASGKAQFQDGWVCTGLTDQAVPAWPVDVMESVKNPGHVLLVNPYKGLPAEAQQFNENKTRDGYILLDVSDPKVCTRTASCIQWFYQLEPDGSWRRIHV